MLLILHTGTSSDDRRPVQTGRAWGELEAETPSVYEGRPSLSPVNVSWWGSHESRKRPCRVSRGIRATGRKAGRVNSSTDQKPERATK